MTPSDLLTLRVHFADPIAASRITPAAASRYLTAHGWRRHVAVDTSPFAAWDRGRDTEQVLVPRGGCADYGARIAELLNRLAEHEGRSVLAVFVDMVAAETGRD